MSPLRAFVLVLVAGCSAAAPHVSADADPQEPEPTPVKPDAAAKDGAPPAMTGDAAPPAADTASPPAPDAAPAPAGAPAMAVETVQVPASGDAVAMKTALAMGELYLLKAWGQVEAGGMTVDAEYAGSADEAGGMDVGVDIGMKQIHAAIHRTPTPPGPGRMKWFGPARADHVYYMTITGEGKPLSLKWTKPAGGSGALSVSLIPLSPTPPRLAAPLETVMVPVAKVPPVMTMMPTTAGKLYLLSASGFGKVGGGGTHMGDADYMDWQEDGTGANEGEAGADFGVPVDEAPGPKRSGAAPQPRARWWGPWRRDHTYYMVFTGTGKAIPFSYFDSGYGDNSPTDALSVKIYEAP
jgi:hypothetical protein